MAMLTWSCGNEDNVKLRPYNDNRGVIFKIAAPGNLSMKEIYYMASRLLAK